MKKFWVVVVCLLMLFALPVFAVTDAERQSAVTEFNQGGKPIKLAEDLFIVSAKYSEDGKSLTLHLLFTHEAKDVNIEKFLEVITKNKRNICETEDAKKIIEAKLTVIWEFYALDGVHLGTMEISEHSCNCKDI